MKQTKFKTSALADPPTHAATYAVQRKRNTTVLNRIKITAWTLCVLAGLFSAAANAQSQSVTVFAAASMKNALDDASAAFTSKTGIKVTASYAASPALMKQIEQGAPADIFLSADLDWMDYGSQKKLIKDETRVNLLGNQIVLIAPQDSNLGNVLIAPGLDLAGDGRIATGDVSSVSVGKYAKARLGTLSAAERLSLLREEVDGKIVFTTSFGIEDQAILQLINDRDLDIDVVTLDTGRLFRETYDLWAKTEQHFGRRIRAVFPRHDELETLVERQGINGFYKSREERTACCYVRKVEPLNRALNGARAWIVGLRADQSANRQDMGLITADVSNNILKLSPLFDWTRDKVFDFVSSHGVPVNSLHEKGFVSIGCAPCTRAIRPGEPERAGRWWWEDETKKECGLHVNRAS
jgi:phosphoadenosine phosphosulfate reductase